MLLIEIRTLDKTISNLEMELAAARAVQESISNESPTSEKLPGVDANVKRKYLMVVGINTAFSSRKRRDSVRATWMPQGSNAQRFFLSCCLLMVLFLLFPYIIIDTNSIKHYSEFVDCNLGEKRKRLEEEKGIIIRFVIGHR